MGTINQSIHFAASIQCGLVKGGVTKIKPLLVCGSNTEIDQLQYPGIAFDSWLNSLVIKVVDMNLLILISSREQ